LQGFGAESCARLRATGCWLAVLGVFFANPQHL